MRKRKVKKCLCLLLFLLGLAVFCYPQLHKYFIHCQMQNTVQSYLEWVMPVTSTLPEKTAPEEIHFVPTEHLDLWNEMISYNKRIWEEKQSGLCDTWSYENPSFCLSDYGFDDEVFGILTIPKMSLEMPLYLGANWQHMEYGAAQLSQTSLPIGGINTNSVIAGHRGWAGAPYFRDIQKLEIGDDVIIQNPWQQLIYRVSDIRIIEPNDVEAIHIQEGRDLVTLLTCHPYATGGKQRYLVICERWDTRS